MTKYTVKLLDNSKFIYNFNRVPVEINIKNTFLISIKLFEMIIISNAVV